MIIDHRLGASISSYVPDLTVREHIRCAIFPHARDASRAVAPSRSRP